MEHQNQERYFPETKFLPRTISSPKYSQINLRKKLFDEEFQVESKSPDSGIFYDDDQQEVKEEFEDRNIDEVRLPCKESVDNTHSKQKENTLVDSERKILISQQIKIETQKLKKKGQLLIQNMERKATKREKLKSLQFSMTINKMSKNHIQSLWSKSGFIIIGLINRFIVRLQKSILFFKKPESLTMYQLKLINDNSSKGPQQGWGVKDEIFKVRFNDSIFKQRTFLYTLKKKLNRIKRIIGKAKFMKTSQIILKKLDSSLPVFFSHHFMYVIWDFLVCVATFICIIFIPFEIGFRPQRKLVTNLNQLYIPIIFIINIAVRANTSYFDSGILIKDRILIILQYFQKEFPLDIFIIVTMINQYDKEMGFALTLYFGFLYKFISTQESLQYISNKIKLGIKMNSIKDLLTLFCKVVYFTHLFACIIHWIGYQQYIKGEQSWLIEQQLLKSDLFSSYATSFYFATITMCTVGYGDITPISITERVCLTILTFFSTAIFGYTLNSIGHILIQLGKKENLHQLELSDLNNYMKEHEVDPLLQNQARQYAQFLHNQQLHNKETQGNCLKILSTNLKQQILKNIFYQKLASIPFFRQFSPLLLQNLAVKVKEKFLGPGDTLMKNGEQIEPYIIFVDQGKLDVSVSQTNQDIYDEQRQTVFKTLSQDDYFGQYEFFCNINEAQFTINSIGISCIFIISLSDFLEALNESHSNDKEMFNFIRDMCILNKQLDVIGMNCFSCKSVDHLVTKCPFMMYGGDKSKMLIHLSKQEFEFRRSFQRKLINQQRVDMQASLNQALKWKQNNNFYLLTYCDVYFLDDHEVNGYIFNQEDLLLLNMGYEFEQPQLLDMQAIISEVNISSLNSPQHVNTPQNQNTHNNKLSFHDEIVNFNREANFQSRKSEQLDSKEKINLTPKNRETSNVIQNFSGTNQIFDRQSASQGSQSQDGTSPKNTKDYGQQNLQLPIYDSDEVLGIHDDSRAPQYNGAQPLASINQQNIEFLQKQRRIFQKQQQEANDQIKPNNYSSQKDSIFPINKNLMQRSSSFKINPMKDSQALIIANKGSEDKQQQQQQQQPIGNMNETREDLEVQIKEIHSTVNQLMLYFTQHSQINQTKDLKTSGSMKYSNMDSKDSIQEQIQIQEKLNILEWYSFNDDVDKVKSYEIYFPHNNIENFHKNLEFQRNETEFYENILRKQKNSFHANILSRESPLMISNQRGKTFKIIANQTQSKTFIESQSEDIIDQND